MGLLASHDVQHDYSCLVSREQKLAVRLQGDWAWLDRQYKAPILPQQRQHANALAGLVALLLDCIIAGLDSKIALISKERVLKLTSSLPIVEDLHNRLKDPSIDAKRIVGLPKRAVRSCSILTVLYTISLDQPF